MPENRGLSAVGHAAGGAGQQRVQLGFVERVLSLSSFACFVAEYQNRKKCGRLRLFRNAVDVAFFGREINLVISE